MAVALVVGHAGRSVAVGGRVALAQSVGVAQGVPVAESGGVPWRIAFAEPDAESIAFVSGRASEGAQDGEV